MKSIWYKIALPLVVVAFILFLLISRCTPGQELDSVLKNVTGPYRFSIATWEIGALFSEVGKLFSRPQGTTDDVINYFNNANEIRRLEVDIAAINAGYSEGDISFLQGEIDTVRQRNKELVGKVETVLERQIREALSSEGIYNPWNIHVELKIGYPPMNFFLGRPPHVLIVSPRDRIESIREVPLLPDLSVEDMEKIENEIDSQGVSSLVVGIGGMATYPSYVIDTADLRFVLNVAAEEWMHQYLAFTPLGFRYLLDLSGIRPDYDIATLNETVAGIISKEIGDIVYRKYYSPDNEEETNSQSGTPVFDFNREMREIRKTVDTFLAEGEIERAEEFMEQKRQYLVENGYLIRKLNQAYFAFHGAYADSPTSISPIGEELRQLRDRSPSLKEFLDSAVTLTSRKALSEYIK